MNVGIVSKTELCGTCLNIVIYTLLIFVEMLGETLLQQLPHKYQMRCALGFGQKCDEKENCTGD